MHGFRLAAIAAALAVAGGRMANAQDTELPARAGWRLQVVELPAVPVSLGFFGRHRIAGLRIPLADGSTVGLVECDARYCADPAPPLRDSELLPADGVPGTSIARGEHGIVRAWLAEPTQRLQPGPRGLPQAGAVVARDPLTREHRYELPLDAAFEDVGPRLADLDNDGRDEIVVVKRGSRGISLAVLGLSDGGLGLRAETPPIEVPDAVSVPVAIEDFDGDGRLDIALAGADSVLELWTLGADGLELRVTVGGVAAFAPEAPATTLPAAADLDGDSVMDLAVPASDRLSLRLLSFRGGEVAALARIPLASEVVTAIGVVAPTEAGERPRLVVGLADRQLAIVQ
jgi:hypothetical protein